MNGYERASRLIEERDLAKDLARLATDRCMNSMNEVLQSTQDPTAAGIILVGVSVNFAACMMRSLVDLKVSDEMKVDMTIAILREQLIKIAEEDTRRRLEAGVKP